MVDLNKEIELLPSLKIENKDFKASLNNISNYSKGVLENFIYKYYTDHSIYHSVRILKNINFLLEENKCSNILNEHERFILISSALLHDIGMQNEVTEEDSEIRRIKHNEISGQMIIEKWKDIGIIKEYVNFVSKVSASHRGNFNETSDISHIGTGIPIKVDLISNLLYLGDELDITYERVSIERKDILNYDVESQLHFFKHYYVQSYNIEDDRNLYITFRFPSKKVDEYSQIFNKIIIEGINKSIKNIQLVLTSKYNISLLFSKSNIKINEDSVLEEIEPKILRNIRFKTCRIYHYENLRLKDFSKLEKDIDAELFYKGNLRWSDIVNNLDIKRTQYDTINNKLDKCYEYSIKNQKPSCLLISGEGGSGKSTLQYRLAYDLVTNTKYEICDIIFLKLNSDFNFDEIKNLYIFNKMPIFVFIDCVNTSYILKTVEEELNGIEIDFPLIFIFASRYNEWINSMRTQKIKFDCLNKEILKTLSENEMKVLLSKLEKYEQLYELKNLSPDKRFEKLKDKSNMQLLVAMIEATRGDKFYNIIIDEYNNILHIQPYAAKSYEWLCLLYMYNVLVPQDMMVNLIQCSDYIELDNIILKYTRLVIIKEKLFGNFLYRPRHREIALVIYNRILKIKDTFHLFNKILFILRIIDKNEKNQRYVIINFLKNYITDVIKNQPKKFYTDKIDEIKRFIKKNYEIINELLMISRDNEEFAELVNWSNIFRELRLVDEGIDVYKMIVKIDEFNKRANHQLATLLSRYKLNITDKEVIHKYYENSYNGGNRKIEFLYEYLHFSITHNYITNLEDKFDGIKSFIAYNQEEALIKAKVLLLIERCKLTKDKNKLASEFSEILVHLNISKNLKPIDELAYIDSEESVNPKEQLNKYEKYLLTISPTRPKSVLIRIAKLASKIPDEINKSIEYYAEIFENHVKQNPTIDDFEIIYEYVKIVRSFISINKKIVYELYNCCIKLNETDLNLYCELANFALIKKDFKYVESICKKGLAIATKLDIYNSKYATQLKELLNKFDNSI